MFCSVDGENTAASTDCCLQLFAIPISQTLRLLQDELQEEAVQQDPAKMEEVLNRLSKLQEDAERNRVYDLSTKVQRIMDLMGFQIR